MTFKNIIDETSGSICTITINRPEVLNALDTMTLRELTDAVEKTGGDKSVRVIILTGSGEKAFVSGADIAAMSKMTEGEADEFATAGHGLMNAIASCPRPVIAAVNGFALGGGMELILACDIAYAGENAKFGLPEVKLGLYPGFGGTQRLTRLVGQMKAMELILSGRVIDSKKALEWGIVNRVIPAAELMTEVKKLAGEIAQNGPTATSIARGLVRKSAELPLHTALEEERANFSKIFRTADKTEGLRAFLEKRKPNFLGG